MLKNEVVEFTFGPQVNKLSEASEEYKISYLERLVSATVSRSLHLIDKNYDSENPVEAYSLEEIDGEKYEKTI